MYLYKFCCNPRYTIKKTDLLKYFCSWLVKFLVSGIVEIKQKHNEMLTS